MAELLIQLTKRPDGGAVLRCVRGDGTVTWQRHEGAHGRFFPLHDLTHYAVETTLGFRSGFYGLIADGWDISETTGKTKRGPLPAEAILVEQIVGFLDAERGGRTESTAEEFNRYLANAPATAGLRERREVSEAELRTIRERAREMWSRWFGLPSGQTLELRCDMASTQV